MMDLRSTLNNRLEIELLARAVPPWYLSRVGAAERTKPFAIQCLAGADVAVDRLFAEFPEINVIQLGGPRPGLKRPDPNGSVHRCGVSSRLPLARNETQRARRLFLERDPRWRMFLRERSTWLS
jgi:hypothetical protein